MSEHDAPRLVKPVRNQLSLRPTDLEALVPEDHSVRGVWALVERLDLSAYYEEIESRGSNAGRPATDPAVLPVVSQSTNAAGQTRRTVRDASGTLVQVVLDSAGKLVGLGIVGAQPSPASPGAATATAPAPAPAPSKPIASR